LSKRATNSPRRSATTRAPTCSALAYEFPLVARMAGSLCRLIDGIAKNVDVPLTLIDAHVEAIRIIFRQKIKDGANQMAITLVEELEARTTETLEKAR
jgi:hypothetical protein